jgi:hypothetical protein
VERVGFEPRESVRIATREDDESAGVCEFAEPGLCSPAQVLARLDDRQEVTEPGQALDLVAVDRPDEEDDRRVPFVSVDVVRWIPGGDGGVEVGSGLAFFETAIGNQLYRPTARGNGDFIERPAFERLQVLLEGLEAPDPEWRTGSSGTRSMASSYVIVSMRAFVILFVRWMHRA